MFKLNSDINNLQTRQPIHIPEVNLSTYGINSIRYFLPKLYYNTFKNSSVAIGKGVNNIVSLHHIHNIIQLKGV